MSAFIELLTLICSAVTLFFVVFKRPASTAMAENTGKNTLINKAVENVSYLKSNPSEYNHTPAINQDE